MSSPEREQHLGTIDTAYCYETESIDGPYLGREKFADNPRPHYFCVTEGCAYPIKAAKLQRFAGYDIAGFVSGNVPDGETHSHVPGCPFRRARSHSGNGGGESTPPPPAPVKIERPRIPGRVTDVVPHGRPWPTVPPNPDQLASMIKLAKAAPSVGLIEDVMAADRMMSSAISAFLNAKGSDNPLQDPGWKRSAHSLTIGDNETTYKEGILPFDEEKLADPAFWDRHIIQFKGKPKKDAKNANGFYLNATKKGGLWIWFDCASILGAQSKEYVKALFEDQISKGGEIHCYWWGIQPKRALKSNGPYLWINKRQDAMRIGFQAVPIP